MGLLMSAIDITVVAVAFPHFIRILHTNVLLAAWSLSVYEIAVTAAMPSAETLVTASGARRSSCVL